MPAPNTARTIPATPPTTMVHVLALIASVCRRSRPGGAKSRGWSAIVGELQGDAEVLGLEQVDHGLQVVLLLAGDPQLVALDLGLYALRALVADLLADRLGLVGLDPLEDLAVDLVGLARLPRLAGVQRLQRDVPLDQLLLEHVERRGGPLLGLGGDGHPVLARFGNAGARAPEVEPGAELLLRLVERVVDLLTVDLADDVERRAGCHDDSCGDWRVSMSAGGRPPASDMPTVPGCGSGRGYGYSVLRCHGGPRQHARGVGPGGKWERTENPPQKLGGFKSFPRHHRHHRHDKAPLLLRRQVGAFVASGPR